MPKARNAYSVGSTPPRSPLKPPARCHAMAAAASPQNDEIVRAPGATSSRVLQRGHSMLLENAATLAAEISALQCGQMRTATVHPSVRTLNNRRSRAVKKSGKLVRFCGAGKMTRFASQVWSFPSFVRLPARNPYQTQLEAISTPSKNCEMILSIRGSCQLQLAQSEFENFFVPPSLDSNTENACAGFFPRRTFVSPQLQTLKIRMPAARTAFCSAASRVASGISCRTATSR